MRGLASVEEDTIASLGGSKMVVSDLRQVGWRFWEPACSSEPHRLPLYLACHPALNNGRWADGRNLSASRNNEQQEVSYEHSNT